MKKVYLIAVIFAIIAGVATYMFATEIDKKTTFKDADMVTVLIPTADIDKNVEITADMFEGDNPQIITKEILAADSNDSYIKAQKELVDDANNVHMITVDNLSIRTDFRIKTVMMLPFHLNFRRVRLLIHLMQPV